MEHILLSFFLSSWMIWLSTAAATCFYPNGTSSKNFVPCVDDGSSFSACCAVGDECLTNGLCKATGMRSSTAFWRNLCTDASWKSDACPKYCYDESTSHASISSSAFVLACSNTTYCCAQQSLALSSGNYSYCCGDQDALFTAAPPVHLSGPQNPLPVFTSSVSKVALSSTSIIASSSRSTTIYTSSGTASSSDASTVAAGINPAQNDSSSLSNSAKAGIGAGVAVVVIVIAAAFFTFQRSKGKRKLGTSSEVPAKHSLENEKGGVSHQREQNVGLLSGIWAGTKRKDKSIVQEMSNDGARFELEGARRAVELEGKN